MFELWFVVVIWGRCPQAPGPTRRSGWGYDGVLRESLSDHADEPANRERLYLQLAFLLVAGLDTTMSFFGSGFGLLLDNPDLLTRLRDQPKLIEGYVNEMLRLEPPVQMTTRISSVDTEIEGEPVHRQRAQRCSRAGCTVTSPHLCLPGVPSPSASLNETATSKR